MYTVRHFVQVLGHFTTELIEIIPRTQEKIYKNPVDVHMCCSFSLVLHREFRYDNTVPFVHKRFVLNDFLNEKPDIKQSKQRHKVIFYLRKEGNKMMKNYCERYRTEK